MFLYCVHCTVWDVTRGLRSLWFLRKVCNLVRKKEDERERRMRTNHLWCKLVNYDVKKKRKEFCTCTHTQMFWCDVPLVTHVCTFNQSIFCIPQFGRCGWVLPCVWNCTFPPYYVNSFPPCVLGKCSVYLCGMFWAVVDTTSIPDVCSMSMDIFWSMDQLSEIGTPVRNYEKRAWDWVGRVLVFGFCVRHESYCEIPIPYVCTRICYDNLRWDTSWILNICICADLTCVQ